MRRALGTAVFAGMLGVTFFGIFLTPVFFYVIDSMSHWHLFTRGPLVHRVLRFGDHAASPVVASRPLGSKPDSRENAVASPPATQRERSKPAEENSVEATIADAADTSAVSPAESRPDSTVATAHRERQVTTPPTNSPPSQGAAGRE